MDVTSGKVPSSLKADFVPSDLFDYWDLFNRNLNDESFRVLVRSKTKYEVYKKKYLPKSPDEIKVNPMLAVVAIFRDILYYFVDIIQEIWENICGVARSAFKIFALISNKLFSTSFNATSDPIRETPNLFIIFWLDFKRACLQIYRNLRIFFLDQVLHLSCGFFISVASQDFTYLPQQPQEICNIAPLNLRGTCQEPFDYLTFAGIFVALGVLFSGMSVGSGTFGNEKVVFWRE